MKNTCYILLAGCLWGIISIFISILNTLGFTSMQCVALRAAFTAVILFLYLMATDKKKLKIRLKDLKYFIGTGIFSIVFFNYCYFEAIEEMGGAAVPALLMYTSPIFVMLLSAVFFHEKITGKKIIALLMTFVGLGFVTGAFTGKESLSISVLLLGLGSGLGYALYSIFGKLIVNRYEATTITFYTFLIAAVGAVPMSGIFSNLSLLTNGKGILAGIGLALFSTVLPFMFYTKGLQGMEAGKAAIFATIEPFIAAIVGAVFFHEVFTPSKGIGMFLILAAIVFLNVNGKGKRNSVKDLSLYEG